MQNVAETLEFCALCQAKAGRSINRIAEQYAVIANCDSRVILVGQLENCIKQDCVSRRLIQLHYSRRNAMHDVDHVEIRFAGTAPNFSAASASARKRIEREWKQTGSR